METMTEGLTPNEIKTRASLNKAFLAGEKILGIKFRYNF